MKITDAELHKIHPPVRAWNRDVLGTAWDVRTIVVLRTDSGLEGLGEFVGAENPTVEEDLEQLERLKAAAPAPMPMALVRIQVERGPTVYVRPPESGHLGLKPNDIAGVGEGYTSLVDHAYWYDDGSERFAALWKGTAAGPVFE